MEELYITILACVLLVTLSGICAGLTLGFFSIDPTFLRVQEKTGTTTERRRAHRLLPLLSRHHLLLVTLLVMNTLCNTALPILLDEIVGEFVALILSVTVVLVFGEMVPQCTFVKFAIPVSAFFAPLVWLLVGVTFIVSYPFAKVLDCVVGHEEKLIDRGELGEFFHLHELEDGDAGEGQTKESMSNYRLTAAEVNVMKGAMVLAQTCVKEVMKVKQTEAFMLSSTTKLTRETISLILSSGFSRIPVYQGENRQHVLGVLLVKTLLPLVFCNPSSPISCGEYHLREVLRIPDTMLLEDLHAAFQTGRSHMAIVYDKRGITCGLVTLDDVLVHMQSSHKEDQLKEPSAPESLREQQLFDFYGSVRESRCSRAPLLAE